MIEVLRNRTYASLFTAQVVALLGTGLLTVALGLLAFDLAGAAAGAVLGTALTIKMIAYVGVAPIVAALVERMPKKAVLVTADAVRLAIALCLPFTTEVWQIYLFVFVLQSASATFTPAFQALIPAVLPVSRDYTRALALSRLAYDLESLLSPAIAALLLTVVTPNGLFFGTAAGFALSAALVLSSTIPEATTDEPSAPFWQRLPRGILVFARTRRLHVVLFTNVVVAAATALVLVNSVVYTRGALGLDDQALGVTLAAYGLGSLAAAFAIPRAVDRFGVVPVMLAGTVVVVVGLAAAVGVSMLTATGSGWGALLATWAILGVGTSLTGTPSSRLLAEAAAPGDRHLVYTAQFALSHACFLVTYPLAGWLGAVDLTGATLALWAVAVVAAVGSVVVARRSRESETVVAAET